MRRLEGQVVALQAKLQQTTQSKDELLGQLVVMTRRAEQLDSTTARLHDSEHSYTQLQDDFQHVKQQQEDQLTEMDALKAGIAAMATQL